MWPRSYQDRLVAWVELRHLCQNLDLEPALVAVNDWWQKTPWRPYYLHWDDHANWPDPWQLLADNVYCDLARAVGIVYTLHLLKRNDITELGLIQTDDSNLVQVNLGKYILNWNAGHLLNIESIKTNITRTLDRVALPFITGER